MIAKWLCNTLDLGGRDGRLSFSKLMAVAVLCAGTFSELSAVLGVALLAASFGVKAFLAFLSRKAGE